MSVRDDANWRRRLYHMRTLRALRQEVVAAPDGLDAATLNAAAQNPDHSEAGRAAAEAALRARGEALLRWRLRVPGFITAQDLKKGERLFFGVGRVVRKWSGICFYLSLLGAILLAALATHFLRSASNQGLEELIACEYHGACAMGDEELRFRDFMTSGEAMPSANAAPEEEGASRPLTHLRERVAEAEFRAEIARVREPLLYGETGIVGVICIAPLLLWLLATAFRRKPARVLLLRKFNERHIGEGLTNMISNEMRPYGHIASLSDKHIRRDDWGWLSTAILSLSNPLAAAWFIIGAPIRFFYRLFDRSGMGPVVVLNARDYRNLARRLRDRIGLNLQTALTSKEAFLVRTGDAWWKLTVRLFMDSADVIVVDLSQVTSGTAWELDVIREEGAMARCVFVALWGKGEAAEAALQRWGFAAPCHLYAPDGHMLKRADFRAAMLNAVKATYA